MRISDWSSDVCSSDLLMQRMDDKVDWRAQRLLDRVGADQPFLGLSPISGAVGHFLLADDDEDVVIRLVLVRRQRRIDPVAATMATEQDDLEDAGALASPGRIPGSRPETTGRASCRERVV